MLLMVARWKALARFFIGMSFSSCNLFSSLRMCFASFSSSFASSICISVAVQMALQNAVQVV